MSMKNSSDISEVTLLYVQSCGFESVLQVVMVKVVFIM